MQKNFNLIHKVQLKKATYSDKKNVFEWQISSGARKYFKQTAIPTWAEHCKWFEDTLKRGDRTLYIINHDGNDIGTLRLDEIELNKYEVSILISPKAQGKGIGVVALNNISELKEHGTFIAKIRPDNLASTNAFTNAGFTALTPSLYSLKT
ncbi:GNAT family N-acetyltransferase [Pseudoalteromonas sp. SG45-5]|uniref:GNAT family N-acetyltransferase n=1 Tax=unclassified Pseudoalteromonas TaxID=194690 RepID=UPI0015F849DF|nr:MULTISPECIES: GNAT family N-acetyltransferase [unclassified Pseudoalteromonas]MBB1384240.1 GNAT family N-acetyltransferase [Pseudoalteromonas sp. SG45-5]MBB1392542.1 GNAT family N-acetyltransferase [Pseudoalteromonas sp. SG44-4]MBB1448897.1 GNAT family N-acetyltransferase [Pseudoalteromonas sp. SG41-6]